jgi:hypothetical protein
MMKVGILALGVLLMAVVCTEPAPEESKTYAVFDLAGIA